MQIYENFTSKFKTYKNLEEKLLKMNESFLSKLRVNDYDPQKFMKNPNIEENFENKKLSLVQYKKSANARSASAFQKEDKVKNINDIYKNNLKSEKINEINSRNELNLDKGNKEFSLKNNTKNNLQNMFDNNQRLNQVIDIPFDFGNCNNINNATNQNSNNFNFNNGFQDLFNVFANNNNNNILEKANNNNLYDNFKKNNLDMKFKDNLLVNSSKDNRNNNKHPNSNKKDAAMNYPSLNTIQNQFDFDFELPKQDDNYKIFSDPNLKHKNPNDICNPNNKNFTVKDFVDFSTPQKNYNVPNQLENHKKIQIQSNQNNLNKKYNFNFHNNSNFVNIPNIDAVENNFMSNASLTDGNKYKTNFDENNNLQRHTNTAGDSVYFDYNTVKFEINLHNLNLNSNEKILSQVNNNINLNSNNNKMVENAGLGNKVSNINLNAKHNFPSLDSVLGDSIKSEFPPVNSHRINYKNRAIFDPISENNVNSIRNNNLNLNFNKNVDDNSSQKNKILHQKGSKQEFEKILKNTNSVKLNKESDPFEGFY